MRNKMDLKKPHDDAQLAGLARTSLSTEGEDVGHHKSGTARFTEFSKLSAKMVELSLQEAQCNLTPKSDRSSAAALSSK